MAIQVILKHDVPNLGNSGELVKVKPGYARNYLLPKGLALKATAQNVAEIEHHKKVIAAAQAKLLKDAQAVADRLAKVEVQLERQVGQDDKLFGSVTGRDIATALADKGIQIDHKKLVIAEPIKAIGYHTVEVKLGNSVTAQLKVVVTPKQ